MKKEYRPNDYKEVPAETINLEASSKLISKYIMSFFGTINKNPLVGLGVVGTKIFTSSSLVFVEISPLFSLVAKKLKFFYYPIIAYQLNQYLLKIFL